MARGPCRGGCGLPVTDFEAPGADRLQVEQLDPARPWASPGARQVLEEPAGASCLAWVWGGREVWDGGKAGPLRVRFPVLSPTINVFERRQCREGLLLRRVQEANVQEKPPTLSLHGGNQEGMGGGSRNVTLCAFSRGLPIPEGEAVRLPRLLEEQHRVA